MVFVSDNPAFVHLTKTDSETYLELSLLLPGPTRDNTVAEGNVMTCRYFQFAQVESSLALHGKKQLPRFLIRINSLCLERGRHIKHDDIVRMMCENSLHISVSNGPGPILN